MTKKSFTILGVVCVLALLALVAPTPAQAQDQTYYTFVALWAVPRAQWNDFEKNTDQTTAILERQVADGTLVAWGVTADEVHAEDGYTHEDWFTSTSQAGLLKALAALRSSSRAPALANTTKHRDYMLHTIAHGGKTAKANSGYLRVAGWQVKPGRGNDMEEFFKKYIQPDLDKDVADGTVLMYNIDTEIIHTDAPGGYFLAVVYKDGSGIDKATERLAAHAKEDPAVGEGFRAMQDLQGHRDLLARILAYQHK